MDAAQRLPGGVIDHHALDARRLRGYGGSQQEEKNRRSH
jgi:hypothetical protein